MTWFDTFCVDVKMFEFYIETVYEVSTAYDASNSQNKAILKGEQKTLITMRAGTKSNQSQIVYDWVRRILR